MGLEGGSQTSHLLEMPRGISDRPSEGGDIAQLYSCLIKVKLYTRVKPSKAILTCIMVGCPMTKLSNLWESANKL